MCRVFGNEGEPASFRRMRVVLASAAALWPMQSAPARAAGEAALVRVEAVTPHLQAYAPDLALTGQIQARVQSNIAFRVNGKVTARRVEVGQHVAADDVLATVEPVEQQADVSNAEAALSSVEAQAQQAEVTFQRQKSLIVNGYTTRANYDQAEATLNTTKAQVAAAQAALTTAKEQLSYADLEAGQDGIIVSRSVEAGQVVQAGQTVFVLAQDGPRDAVFDVPEVLLTSPPKDNTVDIVLQSDPRVTAPGTVREISPIVDPSSSTVVVKIGLDRIQPEMTLGAAVVGRAHWEARQVYALPWSALFEAGGRPAVWVLDEHDAVSLQPVTIQSYVTGSAILAAGLNERQRVVTAGIQSLYPGQTVAVVEGVAP